MTMQNPLNLFRYISLCAVLYLLAACSSTLPAGDALSTEGECTAQQFALAFAAYRENSRSSALWKRAQCHLGIPETIQEAYALQAEFVDTYTNSHKVIGYKIALGNKGAQNLLGAPAPVVGVLFDNTLIPSGSSLALNAARNPAVEADLLVTVRSEGINDALTIEQVADHIASISAYIEVPDLVLPLRDDMAGRFIATNAAAFRGVVGDTIDVTPENNALQRLANMRVELRDAQGKALANSSGESLMGHPYNAVLFLLEELRNSGKQLKAGEVISLGAYSKPIPVAQLSSEAVQKISVHYFGLNDQKSNKALSSEVFF